MPAVGRAAAAVTKGAHSPHLPTIYTGAYSSSGALAEPPPPAATRVQQQLQLTRIGVRLSALVCLLAYVLPAVIRSISEGASPTAPSVSPETPVLENWTVPLENATPGLV